MQKLYELNVGVIRGCKSTSINLWISPSYCQRLYHREPVNLPSGFERVTTHSPHNDEETSNIFRRKKMLNLINDLQVQIENEEATEEGINNEMHSNGQE